MKFCKLYPFITSITGLGLAPPYPHSMSSVLPPVHVLPTLLQLHCLETLGPAPSKSEQIVGIYQCCQAALDSWWPTKPTIGQHAVTTIEKEQLPTEVQLKATQTLGITPWQVWNFYLYLLVEASAASCSILHHHFWANRCTSAAGVSAAAVEASPFAATWSWDATETNHTEMRTWKSFPESSTSPDIYVANASGTKMVSTQYHGNWKIIHNQLSKFHGEAKPC